MIDPTPMDYVASSVLNATQSLTPEAAVRVLEAASWTAETPEQFDTAVETGVRLEEIAQR
ncbi:MAG: hypothetical protein ACRCYS_16065 [Beijerinckiaceae bacterium]